jgi:hypothetical protein
MLFSSAVVVVALSASLANAFPSSGPIDAGLEARTNCPYNNFLYPKKSCCVKNGGDTPGTPEYVHFLDLRRSRDAELSLQNGTLLPPELLLAQDLWVRIPVSSETP